MSIIKSKYYFKLKKILKKINKKIEELLISTERFYFSDGIKKEDYLKGNLIIEENKKNETLIFNIDIGYKETFKINTTNKIQTTCHSQYVFLNMYLERIKEIMQLKKRSL